MCDRTNFEKWGDCGRAGCHQGQPAIPRVSCPLGGGVVLVCWSPQPSQLTLPYWFSTAPNTSPEMPPPPTQHTQSLSQSGIQPDSGVRPLARIQCYPSAPHQNAFCGRSVRLRPHFPPWCVSPPSEPLSLWRPPGLGGFFDRLLEGARVPNATFGLLWNKWAGPPRVYVAPHCGGNPTKAVEICGHSASAFPVFGGSPPEWGTLDDPPSDERVRTPRNPC